MLGKQEECYTFCETQLQTINYSIATQENQNQAGQCTRIEIRSDVNLANLAQERILLWCKADTVKT